MKAVVYAKYGPPEVLEFRDLAKPVPGDDEILIRTHATTVTSGDWRARTLEMPAGFGLIGRLILGTSKPRQPILGSELAGTVEGIGKDVTRFEVGDKVFAFTGSAQGCYTEYKCMPEEGKVVRMPGNLTFPEAAAMSFGGTTALHFFRKGELGPGDRILINGASGGVGTAAVQIAKHLGAEVIGVCSGVNVELVRSLGADEVVDYTKQDFANTDESYDVLMDTVGTAPYSRCKHLLKDRGRFLLVLGGLPDMLRIPWVSMTSSKKIIAGAAAELVDDLRLLAGLAEAGQYKPVIDRCFSIEQIVEAHRYVDTGRKKGNVAVLWDQPE